MDTVPVLIRWIHLSALAWMAGTFACLVFVARPAARAGGSDTGAALHALEDRLRALAVGAIALAVVAGIADLWRQAQLAAGGDSQPDGGVPPLVTTVLAVMTETRYGGVWLVRHALLVLLGGLLVLHDPGSRERDRTALHVQGLVLALTALGLGAASGHSAASAGPLSLAAGTAAAHLIATGLWAGALGPLLLVLRWLSPRAGAAPAVASAARRFSALGLTAVGLLVPSGLYLAWEHAGSLPALLGTTYGIRLLLKVGVIAGVLGVAGVNRLVVRPSLAGPESPGARRARRLLARLVGVEGILVALVLAAAAALTLAGPARHDDVRWPLSFRWAWEPVRDLPGVRSRVAAGSQLATLGLIALLLALVVRPRRWPIVSGAGLVAMGAGAAIALPPLAVDAYPTTYLRPGVPYIAASVNQGRALYRQHCLPCHGAAGYGDGAAGGGLPRRPADLTAPHVADHTAGDLFWWISQGVPGGGMPGMAAGLSAEERWDVVNFVRTLGASERARELGPVPSTRPVAVAPDFAYTVGVGAERALRDLRGRAVVLLAFFSLPASGERLATLARAYPAVRAAGGEILAIPVGVAGGVYRALARALGEQVAYFPVVIEGAAEAARAYALFRRDFSGAGLEADPSPPAHMELLVDRQGYLRARWLPREAGDVAGWSDPDRLVQAIERLTLETPQVPAAAVHVH